MLGQNKKVKDITSSYHGKIAEFQAKVTEYAASENNGTRINILHQIPAILESIFQTDNPELQNS